MENKEVEDEFAERVEVDEVVERMYRDRLNLGEMEEMYRQTIRLAMKMAAEISNRRRLLPSVATPWPEPYPPCVFEIAEEAGIRFYRLTFEGMLPLYDAEKKYRTAVRDYYGQAVATAVQPLQPVPSFSPAFVVLCHFFSNLAIRDLDNRNRSLVINALRHSGLIRGDDWKSVSYLEMGLKGEERVEVYVTDLENMTEITEYVRKKRH